MTTIALARNAEVLRRPVTLETISDRVAWVRRVLMFTLITVIVLPIPSDCGPERALRKPGIW